MVMSLNRAESSSVQKKKLNGDLVAGLSFKLVGGILLEVDVPFEAPYIS